MRVLLSLLTVSLFSWPAMAKYQVVVSNQVVEEEDERKARREAIDQATDQVTIDIVKKQIGADRFSENKKKIDDEVKALKNRFIPFFKIISSEKKGKEYHFKIEVKVSTADLRQVLQQKGLFASSQKTGITLPFIEFNNNITGESYRWWSPVFNVSNELQTMSLKFEEELFQGFISKGLFLLRPQAFDMIHLVPHFMRKTYLTQTEKVQLTNLKKGQLFIDGRVDLIASPLRENAYRIRVQLSCKQSSNGKSVAEVVRTFDTASGKQLAQLFGKVKDLAVESGEELAEQVYDLWQRGGLETQTLQLAVTGELNHHQLIAFKKALSEKMGLSEGLTERLFEPGRVTFELNYSGGAENLSQRLGRMKLDGFISQVVSSQADQITLDVKATN